MAIHPDVSDTDDSDGSDTGDDSIRDKKQYPVYLDPGLREELNELFRKFNARRELEDKPQVEKNKRFNQALIECALNHNWRDYVERRFEKTSE